MDEVTSLLALGVYIELFQGTPDKYLKVVDQMGVEWLTSIVEHFRNVLEGTNDPVARAKMLLVFAVGIWGKGYDAAPKLEFVVAEEENE